MTIGNDPTRSGIPDAGQSSLLGGTGAGPDDYEPLDEEIEGEDPSDADLGIFDGGLLDDPVGGQPEDDDMIPGDERNPDEDDAPLIPTPLAGRIPN